MATDEARQHRVEIARPSCSRSPPSRPHGAPTSRRSGAASRRSTPQARRRTASSRRRPRRDAGPADAGRYRDVRAVGRRDVARRRRSSRASTASASAPSSSRPSPPGWRPIRGQPERAAHAVRDAAVPRRPAGRERDAERGGRAPFSAPPRRQPARRQLRAGRGARSPPRSSSPGSRRSSGPLRQREALLGSAGSSSLARSSGSLALAASGSRSRRAPSGSSSTAPTRKQSPPSAVNAFARGEVDDAARSTARRRPRSPRCRRRRSRAG